MFKKLGCQSIMQEFFHPNHFSDPYYPQDNSQAEDSNKTLIRVLKKIVNQDGCDWHLQLHLSLWAYRTNIHTPTGATPYSLIFGFKGILPFEIEIPTLRVSLQNILLDEEYRVARLQEQELLDQRCLKAFNHLWFYRNCLWLNYNKRVRTQEFDIGDLVLMENQRNL